MRMPLIYGLIRRRMLVNYRVDADVMRRFLPAPFRPKLHRGFAIAGICLIRLEEIRPGWMPRFLGVTSENAAHRIAVTWDDASGGPQEGVFIPRRDTSSWLNHKAGGRLFPGEHGLARFTVTDDGRRVVMAIRAADGKMSVDLEAHETNAFPTGSCFASLAESSAFFEGGNLGYSVSRDCCRFDGIRLETSAWEVFPLEVESVTSSFFSDEALFPPGSVALDHALIMRNIRHCWHDAGGIASAPAPAQEAAGAPD